MSNFSVMPTQNSLNSVYTDEYPLVIPLVILPTPISIPNTNPTETFTVDLSLGQVISLQYLSTTSPPVTSTTTVTFTNISQAYSVYININNVSGASMTFDFATGANVLASFNTIVIANLTRAVLHLVRINSTQLTEVSRTVVA